MGKLVLLLAALVVAASPADAGRRDRERRNHRARNAAIAVMLLMDGEQRKCEAEYLVHYGDNVVALCQRDILNAENIPQNVRDQWRAWLQK